MLSTILLLICGALTGAFICYLYLRQGSVPKPAYESLREELSGLRTEEGILRSRLAQTGEGLTAAEARLHHLQAEAQEISVRAATETARRSALQETCTGLVGELTAARQMLDEERQRLSLVQAAHASLKANHEAMEGRLAEQKDFAAALRSGLEREFRLIAAASLDQSGARLSELQQAKLVDTLAPFRNELDAFRRQVDEKFNAEADGRNTLKGELHKMLELNQTISRQTENLTTALTKQSKQQGGYGEDVLETILNNAGMIEGEHYYRQHSTRNEDGARIQPDIVIRRPNGLSIVVDSKVSLTHYVKYCDAALTPEAEKSLRREIYRSFKGHIDGLCSKKYDTVEGTADFVLLFTPAENAFTIAANHDAGLRQYAFARNIFVVTPSSLLLVVKMISDLWTKDRLGREAHEIAARAKELYEKACGFLQSFSYVGAALDKARTEWDTAAGRLSGHGGLMRQGELLQGLLGSKTNKSLPRELINRPAMTEGIELPVPKTLSGED